MTTCNIIVADTGPLKTLAYADSLELLLTPGIPVYVTDMVIEELKNGYEFIGNVKALMFIKAHLDKEILAIKTDVPQSAAIMRSINVDPGDESIRRVIKTYYESSDDNEYALLVSEDRAFMLSADKSGSTYLMTTRPFLLELESRGHITDAEGLMIKSETNAIAAGEGPGRGQLNRKKEVNRPPARNKTVKPF
ncbi:MAG: hypothetical protein NTX56_16855 [Proteobacteria bacterium]|nr:hypothetical protein [Pseudomonadota bacterium]